MGGINHQEWGYPHYICLLCVFLLFLLFIDCFVCLLIFTILFSCLYFLTTNTANIFIYILLYICVSDHFRFVCLNILGTPPNVMRKKQHNIYIYIYNVISGIDPMLRPSDLMVCSPPFIFRF
jgi:hypothetical protein